MINFFKSKQFDKRKFKRLKNSLNVKFKIISGENSTKTSSLVKGISKDISPYGIGLETGLVQIDRLHISHDSSMMSKNKLDIELDISSMNEENDNKSLNVIHFIGEVAWYDKKDFEDQYPFQIGVRILEISQEDKDKLETLVNNC